MPLKTTPFNIQDYLKTPKDRREYLQVAMESGDAEDIAGAVRDIAEACDRAELENLSRLFKLEKAYIPASSETMLRALK